MVVLLSLLLAAAEPVAIDARTVVERVKSLDPLLARQAALELRATVAHRRASWDRVRGAVGLAAQEAVYQGGLLASEAIDPDQQDFYDRFSANLTAQIVLPLYAGGAIEGRIESTGARLEASRFDTQRAQLDLLQSALTLYAALISSEEQVRAVERARERSEQLVALASRRKEAGIGTDADVARAELNLLGQREAYAEQVGERRQLEAELAAALMFEPGTRFAPRDAIERFHGGAAVPAELLPELMALESELRASSWEERIARAGWLPRLELFAEGTYGNGTAYLFNGVPVSIGTSAERFGVFAASYSAGARLSWTAWDFFVTRDEVAIAQADVARAEATLADGRREAARRLGVAVAREETADARLQALAGGAEASTRTVQMARDRYQSGSATLTDVISAELDAVSIELRLAQARFAKAQSRLERMRAEGMDLGNAYGN